MLMNRCKDCKWFGRTLNRDGSAECLNPNQMWHTEHAGLTTNDDILFAPDFGCVQWEGK